MDLPIPIAFPSQTGHLCVRLQLPCRALLEAFGYRGTHRKNHGSYHGIYHGIVYSWYVTLYWLVVGNIFFICPCIGNNHPNRKIFFRGVDTGYPSLRGYYHTIPVFLHPSPAPRSNIAGDFSHECFHCSPIKWYIPNFIFRCRNQTLQTSLVFPAS
jgi:hypothetical protein